MALKPIGWRRLWIGVALLWLVIWSAFCAFGWPLPAATWRKLLPGFDIAEAVTNFGPSSDTAIRRDLALWLALLTAMTAGVWLLQRSWEWLQKAEVQERLCRWAVASAVIFILAYGYYWYNLIAPWYDIKTMMTNPASVPVFGQRLLFLWPAMLLKHLVPRVSYPEAFIGFQYVALALSVYFIGEWSAIFIGKQLQFLGQLILGMVLACTFGYFNGHDFGVVASYTVCFLLLYRRRHALYVLAFAVGMLNHQNILLLIPTAFAIMWGREKSSRALIVAGVTTAVYFTIRAILNYALPIPQTHEIKVWWNIRQVVELKKTLVMGQLCLLPWFVAGLAAWRSADPFLKRASVLLPMQYGVFFLYGQLNEVRIFNGILPIVVGMWLCYIRRFVVDARDGRESHEKSAVAAGV